MNNQIAREHKAITPSDSATVYADALWVGVAGNVTCVDRNGVSALYTVPAGAIIPTNITKVMATGTTSTNIVALIL